MPGAGSAEVAYRLEDSFATPDADDDWFQPGVDISVTPDFDNELTRNRQPDDTTADRSRTGNFVGTADVTFTLTDDNWHDLIPFSSGSLSGAGRIVPTAEWYFSTTSLNSSGTGTFSESITTLGTAVVDAAVNYNEGEDVTVTLTLAFGDIGDNTPSTITTPSAGDVFTHHGTSLTVDSVSASGLQTATLSLNGLARRVEDQTRNAFSYVTGAMTPELSADAVFTEDDQLSQALGGSTTAVDDRVTGVTGTLSFTNGNASTISYELTTVQPTTYSWSNLVAPDAELTEPITYHVGDVTI